MENISLKGKWKLSGGSCGCINAEVPGCVHTDLLAAGKIKDPYFRDNEKDLMWIGEKDWRYERSFVIPEGFVKNKNVRLCCEGLDTLAVILINGKTAGRADNMFRHWEFDVKEFLQEGQNSISVLFESTFPYIKDRSSKRKLFIAGGGHHRIEGSSYIRKMQCNYGWDWGPRCVTAGIWKDISLIAYDKARISDVMILQQHKDECVSLDIAVNLFEKPEHEYEGLIEIFHKGKCVFSNRIAVLQKSTGANVVINNPKLWWPNNMGEQNLYSVSVKIITDNEIQDCWSKSIGLRTLKLDRHADRWGESFQFVVNGMPFFAKGANWIPADTFVTRVSDKFYERLISDAASANMNFLRVWGGGIYEKDVFYDLCDRYGICVWQDFMFACSAYPAYDNSFMENVRQEASDNLKRLRHHPCIALLCGNNELEQMPEGVNNDTGSGAMSWDEYKSLFDVLLPQTVKEHAPHLDYWPSSPHTPGENRYDYNNPDKGDAHLWEVWHGRKPFEWYRSCRHRFNSEFGFQSFPKPSVVCGYTLPEDRNISSYIMEYHQRSSIGNDTIIQYMLSWFKLPSTFDMLLWLSQILQGMAMKYAVEHYRRNMPRGMGTLYWQLNDCWPCPSWSSIDHTGDWKALHYMARRFYSPVLVSAVEDLDRGIVQLYLTNDLKNAVEGDIVWTIIDTKGKVLSKGNMSTLIEANTGRHMYDVDIKDITCSQLIRKSIMLIAFRNSASVYSENTVFFSRPKHMELEIPQLQEKLKTVERGRYELTICSKTPALWVWPDVQGIDVKYTDRFFHVFPCSPKSIILKVENDPGIEVIKNKLRVYSLTDTY